MPVMYLESVVDGILKGLDQQVSSLKYSVADSVVRIILIILLVPIRGMEGFLFVMIVSNLLTSFLNIHRLLHITGIKLQWGRWILKPLLSMATSGAIALLLDRIPFIRSLPLLPHLCLVGTAAVLLYGLLILLTGCVTREDLRQTAIRQVR